MLFFILIQISNFQKISPDIIQLRPFYAETIYIQRLKEISKVEKSFSEILGFDTVKVFQFGYDIFELNKIFPVPYNVPEDYRLGPDDRLSVNVWGKVNQTFSLTVDKEGKVVLPNTGPIYVAGLTLNEAEKVIRDKLLGIYSNIGVDVSLEGIRNISVLILGEVYSPGYHLLPATYDLTQVILYAGRIKKTGSLRDIVYIHAGKREKIDLYDLLLHGKSIEKIFLENGDVIFVPPLKEVVCITGEVKRPAIYELRGGETISEVIKMSGGFSPFAMRDFVKVIRQKGNAREMMEVKSSDFSKFKVQNGDIIVVEKLPLQMKHVVSIDGNVNVPGKYEFNKGLTLSDLIKKAGGLKYDTYYETALLFRYNEKGEREKFFINLIKDSILPLNDNDSIYVFSFKKIKYALPDFVKVTLTGEFNKPGVYFVPRGTHLSEVVERAGGFTPNAYLKGAVFYRKVAQKYVNVFVKPQITRLKSEITQLKEEIKTERDPLKKRRKEYTLFMKTKFLQQLQTFAGKGRVAIDLEKVMRKEKKFDVVVENGDSLHVPSKPNYVQVIGCVYQPGIISYAEGSSALHYIKLAGGFTPDALKKDVYVIKASGKVIRGRRQKVEPGDIIVVPPKPYLVEKKSILDVVTQWVALLKDIALAIAVIKK